MQDFKQIAVFCGSSAGEKEIYTEKAVQLGKAISAAGHTLVYGGGSRGLMGAIADSVFESGGRVVGVLPEIFNDPRIVRKDIYSSLIITKDMHERKAKMYALADGFIIMPGGIGTFDEFFEIFTWKQIGYHSKNIALYNVDGFYDGLIEFLSSVAGNGFVSEKVIDSLIVSDDPDKIISELFARRDVLPHKID